MTSSAHLIWIQFLVSQLFLGVFVCLQLSVYLLVSSMGLWIDQLVNGAIARISSFTAIYLALFIFTIIVSSRLLCTQHICADQLMAYIAGPSTLDINGTYTSIFHVTTSTQYTFTSPSTGLVRRTSRNEAHHDRIPPHRLRLPRLLVHHVLLPGLPMDMDPMAVLRQPDRRRAAGPCCDARSGRSLLEELPYGVEAVPYVPFFLHAHVHSFTRVLI